MKNSHFWVTFLVVAILSMPLLFYIMNPAISMQNNQQSNTNRHLDVLETKNVHNITLILNYNDGENVTFYDLTLIDDITPFNATCVAIGEENISYYTAINGIFVKGLHINNTWYNNGAENRNWLYYINGQLSGVSCSVYELSNDTVIEWIFKGGNPFDEDPGTNDNFWLYFGLFVGIGVVCAAGIFLILKRGI